MTASARRRLLQAGLSIFVAGFTGTRHAAAANGERRFAAEAIRMRDMAVAAGDQAYGAVIVYASRIVGYGPSRVVADGNGDAHAERVALRDAQQRLERQNLAGAVIYSTSRPCSRCQAALARAGIARMYVGPDAIDQGPPAAD
jgi:tRNA(adenine34) deaminase